MTRTIVVDSSNTSRLVKRLFVVDSGNVSRQVKRMFVVDSGNVSRLVYTGQDDLSLTAGTSAGTSGYAVSGFGSLTPTVLGDGMTVADLYSSNTAPFPLTFVITGFSSNPGSGYVTSVLINSTTLLGSSASYSYYGGQVTYTWSSGVRLAAGTVYPVVITRG
jgi:hypothetical protein